MLVIRTLRLCCFPPINWLKLLNYMLRAIYMHGGHYLLHQLPSAGYLINCAYLIARVVLY